MDKNLKGARFKKFSKHWLYKLLVSLLLFHDDLVTTKEIKVIFSCYNAKYHFLLK